MKQPVITNHFKPTLASIQEENLNGIPIYYLNDEQCELVKMEWVFSAGTAGQSKALQASFAVDLLLEGTTSLNSKDFARELDELGAYFNSDCGKDFASFSLFVLEQHLEKTLEIIYPIFSSPLFSDDDFEKYKIESQQEFEQNLHNGGYLARQELRKNLYGSHPYGQIASLQSFSDITKEDCWDFANEFILKKEHLLFVSGKVNNKVLSCIRKKITDYTWNKVIQKNDVVAVNPVKGLSEISFEEAKQESVRLGMIIPSAQEPDFLKINLANTILGGYFGSRLMQNIRENKGWTYGINSSVLPGKQLNSLVIATDVLEEKGKDCFNEIKLEIEQLQSTALSKDEFQQVSSYIKGSVLRSFDGVFEQMDRFQSSILNNLDQTHYLNYLTLLDTISMDELKSTYQKYFDWSNFTQVLLTK